MESLQKITYKQSYQKDPHITSSSWEPPTPAWRSTRPDREPQRLERRVPELACVSTGYSWSSTESPGQVLAHPSLRHIPTCVNRTWVLKLGLQGTDSGKGLGVAAKIQPKGSEM